MAQPAPPNTPSDLPCHGCAHVRVCRLADSLIAAHRAIPEFEDPGIRVAFRCEYRLAAEPVAAVLTKLNGAKASPETSKPRPGIEIDREASRRRGTEAMLEQRRSAAPKADDKPKPGRPHVRSAEARENMRQAMLASYARRRAATAAEPAQEAVPA